MKRPFRHLLLATATAALLTACGGLIGLPEPVDIPTAFGFGDGVAVELAAVAPAGVVAAQTGATYEGSIDETFTISATEIDPILRGLVRIDGVSETLSLATTLTVATDAAADFPASFVASGATLSGLTIQRNGATILGPLSFTGFASASMTFTAVAACESVTSCAYTASNQVDLLELGLSGAAANTYAKTIIGGGTFRVMADFALDVDPALPAGATISTVVVGTGAILE